MVTRFDPFKDLMSLQHRMNRLFEDFTRRGDMEPEPAGIEWRPLCDVFEDTSRTVISIDLPGMRRDEISIAVENGVLTIRGERKMRNPETKHQFQRVEKPYGPFGRSFNLPNTVDFSAIKANYADGELTLELPKKEEAKPRTVEIKVG